jgi:predicted phosphodiesterase
MGQTKLSGEIVKGYLKRFPDTPSLTLAKKIYKENGKVFSNVQAARNSIAYYRGQRGDINRKKVSDKTFFKEAGSLNPFNLPESFANDFSPYIISQSNTLIISDLHFPYQDNKAIELALNYGIEKKVNCILINGDLLDFATISRHEKDWRARTVFQEFEAARSFLFTLRKVFPKAKIVFKLGNHDERWEKWLYVKAPELFDDPEYRLEVRLKLGELKIETVSDKRPIRIGKLTVLHGHELAGGGAGGVNPARATFLKTMDSTLVSHYHKTSSHVETSMTGSVISVDSIGCLCGLNPLYLPINKHNLGFAHVELDIKTGEYQLHNKKIVKGRVY